LSKEHNKAMSNIYNTQKDRVIKKLNHDSYITRNECLRNSITRLGAIIKKLEYAGWRFRAEWIDDHKDYKYTVVFSPLKVTTYTVPELGKKIISHK
jgi:hypothetical protein